MCGYSIGIHTKTESQAQEILNFIENNIPPLFPNSQSPMDWCTGKDMAYINDNNCIGTNYSLEHLVERVYFYTIMYHIGIKFGLTTIINNVECVLINYDNEETFYLSHKNPFPDYDDKYYSFVKIRQDGIKYFEKRNFISTFLGLSVREQELQFIKNII